MKTVVFLISRQWSSYKEEKTKESIVNGALLKGEAPYFKNLNLLFYDFI